MGDKNHTICDAFVSKEKRVCPFLKDGMSDPKIYISFALTNTAVVVFKGYHFSSLLGTGQPHAHSVRVVTICVFLLLLKRSMEVS